MKKILVLILTTITLSAEAREFSSIGFRDQYTTVDLVCTTNSCVAKATIELAEVQLAIAKKQLERETLLLEEARKQQEKKTSKAKTK